MGKSGSSFISDPEIKGTYSSSKSTIILAILDFAWPLSPSNNTLCLDRMARSRSGMTEFSKPLIPWNLGVPCLIHKMRLARISSLRFDSYIHLVLVRLMYWFLSLLFVSFLLFIVHKNKILPSPAKMNKMLFHIGCGGLVHKLHETKDPSQSWKWLPGICHPSAGNCQWKVRFIMVRSSPQLFW